MSNREYFPIIEAILFASGEPLSISRMAQALEIKQDVLKDVLDEFMVNYNSDDKGICVIKLGECYQMCTKKEYEKYIKAILELKKQSPLSQAALEVLAIIAYNQPVTRSFIEQVRGVDSSSIVNSLNEKCLIEEAGRLEVPGRPIAYKTTNNFLRSFGMSTLDDLPPIPNESKSTES